MNSPLRYIIPLTAVFTISVFAVSVSSEQPAKAADEAGSEKVSDIKDSASSTGTRSTGVLRARHDDFVFIVNLEPGNPQKGRRLSLRLDLATVPENPDPTFGDRIPVRDASIVAVLSGPENRTIRQAMHPYGGAGTYGLHWTPEESGLWELKFERLDSELAVSDFRIGVDVPTPEQDDPSLTVGLGGPRRILGGLDRGQRGGGVVGPLTPVAAGPTATSVMREISEPAVWLAGAIETDDSQAAREALASILEEAKKLPGTVPERYKVGAPDYERLATDLVRRLEAMNAHLAEDLPAAKTAWRDMLDNNCAQCHVKFWWGISSDVSAWPHVPARPWGR